MRFEVDMNKVKIIPVLTVVVMLLLASCAQPGGFSNPVEVANDASSAQIFLTAISAGFYLAEDSEGLSLSRTVNDGFTDGGTTDFSTPDSAYGGSSGTITIDLTSDASAVYYNASNKARISMTPLAGGVGYKIVLKVYPLDNFDVNYQQETYYVKSDSWTNYADDSLSSSALGWEDISVYYADGSVGQQTVDQNTTFFSGDPDENFGYAAFDVPLDVIANQASYLSTISPPTDIGTSGDNIAYSARSTTAVGPDISSVDYYTEIDSDGDAKHLGDQISSINIKDVTRYGSTMTYVSRFTRNLLDGSYTYRSLGQKTGGWWSNTEVEERDSSVTGGVRSYTGSTKLWYKPLAQITPGSTPSREDVLSLTETSAGSGNYAGTLDSFWGNRGNSYTVALNRLSDGSTRLITSYLSSVSRGVNDIDISMNSLDQPDGISFTFPGSYAVFSGSYEQGALTGTYSIGSRSADIEITASGISVNGDFYPNEELSGPF